MTKYEIAVRLLAEYCDCPTKDGTAVDLPMEWCENHCKYEGDDIGHEETLQCWEKVINDRYEAQGEEDKPEPCEDAVSREEAKRILFDFAGCIVDTPNGIYQQAYKKYNDMMDNLPCVTPKPEPCEAQDDEDEGKRMFEVVFDNPRPTIEVVEYDNELDMPFEISLPMTEAARKMGGIKGLFLPGVTVEEFKNGDIVAVEDLISSGEVYDVTLRYAGKPKTVRWEDISPEYHAGMGIVYRCSACKEYYTTAPREMHYCLHCGAKMEVDSAEIH